MLEASCICNIAPHSRKHLKYVCAVLDQESQNDDPAGRHIPIQVLRGSPPPPTDLILSCKTTQVDQPTLVYPGSPASSK